MNCIISFYNRPFTGHFGCVDVSRDKWVLISVLVVILVGVSYSKIGRKNTICFLQTNFNKTQTNCRWSKWIWKRQMEVSFASFGHESTGHSDKKWEVSFCHPISPCCLPNWPYPEIWQQSIEGHLSFKWEVHKSFSHQVCIVEWCDENIKCLL